MKIETLNIFCDLVETRSFTRTAERNGITQSAISQQLWSLEREFKSVLAVRNAGMFQLTPAGDLCHQRCLEIVRLTMEMDKRLQQARDTSAGTIELAACYSIGLHQLPPVLDRFRRDFPKVEIHVRYEHIDRVHELVLHNEVDLGLVAYPRRRPGLAIERVRDERLVLVCHPQHRFAGRPAVPLSALRNLLIIAWQEIPWVSFLKKVPDSQRHLFEPRHVFKEVEMVKQAVEKDVGVTVLPAATIESEVANHLLTAVPFEDGRHTEPVAVIYRKNRKLTPAMTNFIQTLKQPVTPAFNG